MHSRSELSIPLEFEGNSSSLWIIPTILPVAKNMFYIILRNDKIQIEKQS